MNCDADEIATRFHTCMDKTEVMPIREGYLTLNSKVCLLVQGKQVTSNFQHLVCHHIQGQKHYTSLKCKHGSNNAVWNSIDWTTMKGAFLTLGPMKWIKTSKQVHGWLNTGQQKSKILPDVVDAHKCPCCQVDNESHEHILLCPAGSAHHKWYELVHSMSQEILWTQTCTVQLLFVWFIRSWLVSPEALKPDVSLVPEAQCDLVVKALEDQECIGWHLAMHGYWLKQALGASSDGTPDNCTINWPR